MKKITSILAIIMFAGVIQAQVSLSYYLPQNVTYKQDVPTPRSILGFEVGEMLVSHDKLVEYMKVLAKHSDRMIYEEYARSYENRPLFSLIVSSPQNQKNLDQIKADHQKLSNPEVSKDINVDDMPVVVVLGYSVHGNESSAVNSSLIAAYYLAAAEGPEIDELLSNAVIIVDPALNPDGVQRHANWVNINKSKNPVSDGNGRIFNETWPGGRTNHYWFDMNRDYLLLTHPETRGRVKRQHEWFPNLLTDHHEMGSSSTFFFQPGVPSRNNPLTPIKNYELTRKIAKFHAKQLDDIKTLYYSEEGFDDFYFGKGSSYPDINAGVGILFEQASLRGFKRDAPLGQVNFPYAIKNQFEVALSSLKGALSNRKELLNYQKAFYYTALDQAAKDEVKAYIFGEPFDKAKMAQFLRILKMHHIDVYKLKDNYSDGTNNFETKYSYVVPCKQKNYLLMKSLFEKARYFKDKTFYDVTTWNLPMSFNIPYTEVKSVRSLGQLKGELVQEITKKEGSLLGSANPIAWTFSWDEYYAPRAVSKLMEEGIKVRVAKRPFSYQDDELTVDLSYGSIQIPVERQSKSLSEIRDILESIAKSEELDIFGIKTGWTNKGIDAGSNDIVTLKKPNVLMLIEGGISASDAGEIWHLLDTRYSIPVNMVPVTRINRVDLSTYNTIIIPGARGSFGLAEQTIAKMKNWVVNGGTLIAYKSSSRWANAAFNLNQKFKERVPNENPWPTYIDRRADANLQAIKGAIFKVEMDLSHPLAYGFNRNILPVFKTGDMVAELTEDLYGTPFRYTSDPLLSGYVSDENHDRIKGAAFVSAHKIGRGIVISLMDNTNFRGVWYGTNKVFANAIFFGDVI